MMIYVVQKGDTLYQIAQKFQISIQTIVDLNQLTDIDHLVVGQSLVISTTLLPEIEVNGYCYPNIRDQTLEDTLPFLTYISIFSYHVNEDGTLTSINDERIIIEATKQKVASMLVITNINQEGRFDSELAHVILTNTVVQENLFSNLISIMKQKGYYGLDIDFEYVFPEDRTNYNFFLSKIVSIMHQNKFTVATALAPKVRYNQEGLLYEAHDYYAHGKYADHVILMTYEWGYTYGPPMAVAPFNQVEKVLQYALTVIPSEKILMRIPNYGYDWTLPYQSGVPAKSISNTSAVTLAQQMGSEILFDSTAMSPYFYYRDSDDKLHVVWFEDARSISAKLELVKKYHLGGISYWTIMNFFSQGMAILDNTFTIKKLI